MKVRELNLEKLPKPKNLYKFHEEKKYSIEIGAGVGFHAIRFALENPSFQHIAIERTTEKFNKMLGRKNNHEVANLDVFQDDAVNWIAHNCPDNFIDKVLLLYPNPNPKNKAARWIHMPFFSTLVCKMKIGGELLLATNEDFYANEFLENFETYPLELVDKIFLNKEELSKDYRPLTHFEKKYLNRGETCKHLLFKKNQ